MPFLCSRASKPPRGSLTPCTGTIPSDPGSPIPHQPKTLPSTQPFAQHTTYHAPERRPGCWRPDQGRTVSTQAQPTGQTSQPGTPRDAPEPDSP